MTRILSFFGTRLKKLLASVPLPQSPIGRLMAALSALGLAGLGYLCGAAVMFFQLPSHGFLNDTLTGANAWYERGRAWIAPGEREMTARVTVDEAAKTSDGFTLYTTTDGAQATLLDMRATVVHRWELPFSQAWSRPPHVEDSLPDDQIHWFRCHLYANGDLLAIYQTDYQGDNDTPYGYGLVKVDKDSKLLWAYPGRVHHDVDVDEDGTIYTLTQKIIRKPPAGVAFLPAPSCLTDSLVVLSPEGKELESIPLLEAVAQSPYVSILDSGTRHAILSDPRGDLSPQPQQTLEDKPIYIKSDDLLHTDSVKVLSRTLAPKFPLFKPGQILLSLRNRDTVAVLDRPTRRVVWAAQGIWQAQHDAEFLENGHLLVYDNLGSRRGTRILEYAPQTQAFSWTYTNENVRSFKASLRGMAQRLPNGNTLIVDPDNRRLFEVTRDRELVWETICPLPLDPRGGARPAHAVNCARRYGAEELTFLKGVAHARP
jgi:hypothetical protein